MPPAPRPVTHRVEDDLGATGDAWLTDDDGADAEILAGLGRRLEAEALMDEIDRCYDPPR